MKILWLDEDQVSLHYYMLALDDHKLSYQHIRLVDQALKVIQTEGCVFDLVILDSAIPAGAAYLEEATEDGTQTGKFLFRDIRAKCPNVPILILTNFWLEWVQSALTEKLVKAEKKINVTPNKLIEIIRQMVKEAKQ